MNTTSDPGSCKRRCWTNAAIAGLVLFLILWILTSLGFFSSLLWGVIVFVVLGFVLSMMLCRETASDLGSATPPSSATAAPPASAPPAAKAEPEPAAAPEPAAPAASEPPAAAPSASAAASDDGSPLKHSTDLPGQRDLEARKGAWRYEGGDGSASTSASASTATTAAPHGAAQAPEAGSAPARLDGPRGGVADDLKLIKGVGPKMERLLHSMGFYHFDQIAVWTEEEVAWVDNNLEGFKGRVSRDKWVDQARALAAGEETEFAQRAKKDGRYD